MAKKKSKKMTKRDLLFAVVILLGITLYQWSQQSAPVTQVSMDTIPEYEGMPFTAVEGNQPSFTEEDMTTVGYEYYAPLDYLGRCGVTEACVGPETLPTEGRGDISSVYPSGWEQEFYDFVDGEALYNRCHLIGFQLTGENANECNLITGTRTMNVEGMLPFENMVADYVKETDGHVLYRVTPYFVEDELVARGVQMEALSVEDNGESVCFNVFCFNVEPGVEIDYETGYNWLAEENAA